MIFPAGELATAGKAFDVLAFSGSCWSWSVAHTGRQALVASAMQGSYLSTARQAGGRQSGQLQQQASPVSRSRTQWQRQHLQQHWQEQQRQAKAAEALSGGRPGTAAEAPPAGSTTPQDTGTTVIDHSRPATAGPVLQKTLGDPRQRQLRKQDCGPVLQPTDAEHLEEAQAWVHNWPEAVGSTNLLTALKTAHQYTYSVQDSTCRRPTAVGLMGATAAASVMSCGGQLSSDSVDCYYLFSDGLADDAAACLEWVQQRAEAGTALRPVHTVGALDVLHTPPMHNALML